jgi:hypothetical protein
MGRTASQREDGSWHFEPRFDYSKNFWVTNIPSWFLAPLSLAVGGSIKMFACISPEMRERQRNLRAPQPVHLHTEEYRQMGLFNGNPIADEWFTSLGFLRQPGDENHLAVEKEALRNVGAALTKAGIYWWVDCGSCLGAYRYGGAIPWDLDVDIAILEPDFENVYSLLKQLDPEKYLVLDMSSRDEPMTLIKVMLREFPGKEIDIYHFRIDPEAKTLNFVLSQENHTFLPDSWKIRERPFKAPANFEDVFPLKKALFDGIEVFVPNNIVRYLSRVYGKDLSPVKKYDPKTGNYEKDLSHPYWLRPFAH